MSSPRRLHTSGTRRFPLFFWSCIPVNASYAPVVWVSRVCSSAAPQLRASHLPRAFAGFTSLPPEFVSCFDLEHPTSNSFVICSYKKSPSNLFIVCSSKTKSFTISSYEKRGIYPLPRTCLANHIPQQFPRQSVSTLVRWQRGNNAALQLSLTAAARKLKNEGGNSRDTSGTRGKAQT